MKTARFIWLSPSMAREMLERDARLPEINRAIEERHVRALQEELKCWQCNGEPVIIATSGRILNARQWRLKRGVFPRVPVAPIT